MKRVLIVQPYVPAYRVGLFEQLRARLAEEGIALRVAAGTADAAQARRGDAAELDGLIPLRTRRVGPAVLTRANRAMRGADAVVFPLMGTWMQLNTALLSRALGGGRRVGVWGHVDSFVADSNPIDAAIERRQIRRADHVFAYTDRGARVALDAGARPERVTVLRNTLDTLQLERALADVDDAALRGFVDQHDIDPARTIAYIGGLDAAKRVDVLVEALDALWERRPDVRVLVGGRGAQETLLKPAADRGQVVRLGFVGAADKALIARSSRLLLNPGRVGLVAVDALAMGLPIVTLRSDHHAPEIEYLAEGESLHTVERTAELARVALAVLDSPTVSRDWVYPRLPDMVERFADGILRMLECAPEHGTH